jgi:phosphonate transport system substrate-binding protein|tara:strand:+ start:377 stop:1291 length:915 start_codon:yes stop_codon:yes gene_type:complete
MQQQKESKWSSWPLLACALILLSIGMVACGSNTEAASEAASDSNVINPEKLRVALLPDEDASTIIKNNEGLKAYLEDRLDKDIELVVTTDYSSMIEAMRFGRIELAYFGAVSYVLASLKADIEPFCASLKNSQTTYNAVVIAGADTGISSIEDIRGKDMAFGDIASTSSHLIPRMQLLDKGLEIDKDYTAHYTGTHDAVAIAVQNGNTHAGGLSEPIFQTLVDREIVSLDKIEVIEISPDYPNYPWTMQSNLDPQLKDEIVAAFIELDDPDILKPLKAEGFGRVTDADYVGVRNSMKRLGMIES